MSNHRSNGSIAELPDTAHQARYRSNRRTSGTNTSNSNLPTSSGHATGAYVPSSHASNNDWNMANEMEQYAFCRRPVGLNLYSWERYAERQHPQPLPWVNIMQQPPNTVESHTVIANGARQTQHYYAPLPPSPTAPPANRRGAGLVPNSDSELPGTPLVVPEGAVRIVEEVTLEPQLASTRCCGSFTSSTQPPVTTIQATTVQTFTLTDQPHTVTLDQLKAIKSRRESRSRKAWGFVQRDFALQNDATTIPGAKVSRKGSLRVSVRNAAQVLLTALRLGEPPVEFKADDTFLCWRAYLSKINQRQDNMEDAFDPFQDTIEEAFDAKYKELLGEGKFLIDEKEEAKSPAEVSIQLPDQEAAVIPTADAEIWLAYRKAEESFSEVRDAYTGSARRQLSVSELVVHPPKPRTYPVGPDVLREPLCRACSTPCSTGTISGPRSVGIYSVEPDSVVDDQHYSTPESADSPEPEAEAEVDQMKPPNPQSSRLPRVASVGRSGRSISRLTPPKRRQSTAPSVEGSAAQPRKDSVQTGPPNKPAVKLLVNPPAQSRALSRDSERYAKIQNLNRQRWK